MNINIFEENKSELEECYKEVSNIKAEFISVHKLENMLEETIAKYVN